jgi:sporulation protein YlmC with PRC-barrel domain
MNKTRQMGGMAVLTALSLGLSAETGCAAQAPQPSSGSALQREAAPVRDAARLGLIQKTTDLIGKQVQDRNDKSVGKIEDVILDLPNGLVIAAFVSSGAKGQVTPVPARSFLAGDKDKVAISVDQKVFKSAPTLPGAPTAGALTAKSLSESFRHFGQPMPDLAAASASGFSSSAALAGAPLMSQDNQPLGQVETIMVDVPAGQVVYLIVKPSGAEQQKDFYVLPPAVVKPEATGQTLVLNATQAHFVGGPHFQTEFWADMTRPELAAAVHQHYPTPSGAAGNADPTRLPVRARIEAPSSATASLKTDAEITEAVKKEIMSEIALEIDTFIARGLQVKTVNGRVTIAGHLKDEAEKQHIIKAAKRVVNAVDVDDQLDPRPK